MISGNTMMRQISSLLTILLLTSCQENPFYSAINCQELSLDMQKEKLARIEENYRKNSQDEFKVLLLSDPQTRPGHLDKTVLRLTENNDFAFAMLLGDLTENGIAREFDWVCTSLKKLNIPVFPVIGNHDAIGFGKELWQKYIGSYDYTIDFLDTRMLAYNDNAFEFEIHEPNFDWIADNVDVEKRNIVASHIPPSVDVHTQLEVEKFISNLESIGVQNTIHGHHHKFKYWQVQEGIKHHITSAFQKGEYYSIMTVKRDVVEFENCYKDTCWKPTLLAY
tara:strand:- start:1001 stop:1837 length:837 start_codon:yes stop_codon:yes gene_type:complete